MMTESEFRDALLDAASAEFEGAPLTESDCPHEFSERFERRMDRLVKAEERSSRRFLGRKTVRILAAAAAVVALLALIACAVPIVKAAFIPGFIVDAEPGGRSVMAEKAEKTLIEEEYELTFVPEGFELFRKTEFDSLIHTEYRYNNDRSIVFRQIAGATVYGLDNQHGIIARTEMSGKQVLLYCSKRCAIAVWLENGYEFELSFDMPELDLELFRAVFDSISAVE